MPTKKKNEAAIAPSPVSAASVPVTKKPLTRAAATAVVEKTVKATAPRRKAAAPVAVEKTAKVTAPRRKATPKTKIADTANVSIANLSDAIETQQQIDARAIEERAYQSWLERGCPMGSPQEDWYRAERELIARVATAAK